LYLSDRSGKQGQFSMRDHIQWSVELTGFPASSGALVFEVASPITLLAPFH